MAERNVRIRIQDGLFNEAVLRKDASAEKNKYKLHRYIPPNSSDRQNAKLHKEIGDFAKSIKWWNSYAEKIPPVVYFSEWIASRRGGLLRKNIEYINRNISQLDVTPRAVYNKTISVYLVFLISGYLMSLFFNNTLYKLIILAISVEHISKSKQLRQREFAGGRHGRIGVVIIPLKSCINHS